MNDKFSLKPKPIEIRVNSSKKLLEIDFDDGAKFDIPAELLRVESPSADVQGHGPSQKKTIAGRRYVGIIGVEQIGNYAIKISFDDMHDTGIFSWETLYDFGVHQEELWENYINNLDAKGLSRDP